METPEEKYKNLSYLFNCYLHQDWTIEGENLSEVFDSSQALQNLSGGIQREAETLLAEEYDNQFLDDIFFGQWGAGYEPEADGLDDWQHVLKEIVRYCDRYTEVE
ncbi:contact-dependent growth inhibition system immunity protein [Streptomonospora nanhaiensis]|uniref:Contact-dependent growth inhibition system immunity protein n=1 Tax=Streptomonospora nanhaiensis TaxID=1323731 RepID=A0ABY6YTZ2_9ACTN|nr:contact-dependent growth inhibition system immunity protein [Streptomonospora nanhaiensis]WAE75598.1 contact-dependent growth inhibition system immunity protein [Streptomonospora nanhaiensis]